MGLGSEIRDPEKTYSGSRVQGSKRHRIPDPDPQHWFFSHRTNIGDSILHAGIGGPAGGVLPIVYGEPDLEQVEGVEQHRGGHAPAHTRHQVLHPATKSKFTNIGDP